VVRSCIVYVRDHSISVKSESTSIGQRYPIIHAYGVVFVLPSGGTSFSKAVLVRLDEGAFIVRAITAQRALIEA
jgi:hypothetical protein